MHATPWPNPRRGAFGRFIVLFAFAASVALVPPARSETRPASERPLLTITSSWDFPHHCDTGGCVPATIVDRTLHLLHDGSLLEIADSGTPDDPFGSFRVERKVGGEGLRELRQILSRMQLLDAGECEAGSSSPPYAEETWTWYRTAPGSRYRFRMHMVPTGTTGLPACPRELLDLWGQGYWALRLR